MIHHAVEQGSIEWMRLRLGIPTASNFDRIITPKTMKVSTASRDYLAQLCAEWLLGGPVNPTETQFMERGKALEPEARAWFEWENNVTVEPGGFVTTDDGSIGCSPDGTFDNDGLEIKCYEYVHHVRCLLDEDDGHKCQIQGCLWLTGRERWHRLYYNPALPPVVVTVERDEEFIEAMAEAVTTFAVQLAEARAKLLARGCKPIVLCPATGISELICRCERHEERRNG